MGVKGNISPLKLNYKGFKMRFLILFSKVLIILSYLITGLYIIEIAPTTIIKDMNFIDYFICVIGSTFVLISFYLFHIFSELNK
tara:strand:- start:3318 stop:3569 length:252 start_codon:yes stop_codon:yes gene_type:complete